LTELEALGELNRRFGSDRLRFDAGHGGLLRATLTARTNEVEIYLYGAHVTRFQKRDGPSVLFLSEQSSFVRGKAIRGGIPVIFPWFGAHPSDPTKPTHGFARMSDWNVVAAKTSTDQARIVLSLTANDATRALWPHEFVATLVAELENQLTLSLEVANASSDSFKFEEGLHTYLTVADISQVSVRGLEEATYIDKADSMKRKQHGSDPVIIDGEIDSVFLSTAAVCTLHDPVLRRKIIIEKSGSRSTVIWNPYSAKARAMSDFGDDEWHRMLCVETCNVAEDSIYLEAGGRWMMTAVIDTLPVTS
jgi:D-hexose-6-phosphate mutarotase